MGAGGSKFEEGQRVRVRVPVIVKRRLEEIRCRRNQLALKATKNTLSKKNLLRYGNEEGSSRPESSGSNGNNRSTSLPPHIEPLASASPNRVVPTNDDGEVLGFTKTIKVTTTTRTTTQTTITTIEQDLGEVRATKVEEKKREEGREEVNKIITAFPVKEHHLGEERAATEVEEKKREEEREEVNKIITAFPVKEHQLGEERAATEVEEKKSEKEREAINKIITAFPVKEHQLGEERAATELEEKRREEEREDVKKIIMAFPVKEHHLGGERAATEVEKKKSEKEREAINKIITAFPVKEHHLGGERAATEVEEKKSEKEREAINKIITAFPVKEHHLGEERAATEFEEKKSEEEREDANKIIGVVPLKKDEEMNEVQKAEEEDHEEEEDLVVELMGGAKGTQHFICPGSPSFRIYLVDPPLNRNNSKRDDASVRRDNSVKRSQGDGYIANSQPVSAERRFQRSQIDERITISQEGLETEVKKERKGRGFRRVSMRKAITRGGSTMRPNMRQLLNMRSCMSAGATAHRRNHSYRE